MNSSPKSTATTASVSDPAYRAAEQWAFGRGAGKELAARFAFEYSEMIVETPALLDPDRPAPTPAEFADESAPDYAELVDVPQEVGR